MNTGAEENVGQKPGYIYELTADIGCGRNISVRGNFPLNADATFINGELDKLVKACDRQLSKAVVPSIEHKLKQEERTLATYQRNVKDIQKQQQGHKNLPAVAQSNLENAQANVTMQESVIADQKALLERTKQDAK